MIYIIYNLFVLLLPTKVYINIEKPNKLITHTGITFINDNNEIRYDFRAFNDGNDYNTTEESRKNMTLMFPNINNIFLEYKGFNQFRDDILLYSYTKYLGDTEYSLNDIINYEKKINKKYILGVYDCRHYVNELTLFTLNIRIPIWNLDSLL